jgi:hypothetical protein
MITGSRAEGLGYVPIWTSRLFVTDWFDTAPPPFRLEVSQVAEGWQVEKPNPKDHQTAPVRRPSRWNWQVVLENQSDHALVAPKLVVSERLYTLADVPPHGLLRTNLPSKGGETVGGFVDSCRRQMNTAVQSHQSAFGEMKTAAPLDAPRSAMAASFMPDLSWTEPGQSFLTRDRLVISPAMREGKAILLLWDDQSDMAKPLAQFSPSLQTRRNLLRMAVPVKEAAP